MSSVKLINISELVTFNSELNEMIILKNAEVAIEAGIQVKVIGGSEKNIKITAAADFERVMAVLGH